MTPTDTPRPYAATIRILIRYAIVMVIVGLLVGISYQESAKKLPFSAEVPGGLHLEAVIHLALVHGHVFTVGVLIPLAMAGALVLGLRSGGREVSSLGQRFLLWGYLPGAAASLLLQLYKGYHVLLMARGGTLDFVAIDAAFMGGHHVVRYGVYGLVHTIMGVGLGGFGVHLWRSLRQPTP